MAETVLLLAGGRSSRMGQLKGLLELPDGRTWIEHQLEALSERSGASQILVVLGHEHERYLERVPALSAVINPAPERGAFTSLQTGLRACSTPAWVLPIDVPCPRPETWHALRQTRAAACIPTYQGRGGHPVLISRELSEHLIQLDPSHPDSRLDRQLHIHAVVRVPTQDPTILHNLNTPDDWHAWRQTLDLS